MYQRRQTHTIAKGHVYCTHIKKKLKKKGQQVHVLMYAVSCGREVQYLSEVFWIKSYIKLLLLLVFFWGGGKGREGTVWQLKSLKPHVSVKQYVTFSQRSLRDYRHIDDSVSLDWGRNYHLCIFSRYVIFTQQFSENVNLRTWLTDRPVISTWTHQRRYSPVATYFLSHNTPVTYLYITHDIGHLARTLRDNLEKRLFGCDSFPDNEFLVFLCWEKILRSVIKMPIKFEANLI